MTAGLALACRQEEMFASSPIYVATALNGRASLPDWREVLLADTVVVIEDDVGALLAFVQHLAVTCRLTPRILSKRIHGVGTQSLRPRHKPGYRSRSGRSF